MSFDELVARYIYMCTAILHRTEREFWFMTQGEIVDQIEIHNQYSGYSRPAEQLTIDDVLPM